MSEREQGRERKGVNVGQNPRNHYTCGLVGYSQTTIHHKLY